MSLRCEVQKSDRVVAPAPARMKQPGNPGNEQTLSNVAIAHVRYRDASLGY